MYTFRLRVITELRRFQGTSYQIRTDSPIFRDESIMVNQGKELGSVEGIDHFFFEDYRKCFTMLTIDYADNKTQNEFKSIKSSKKIKKSRMRYKIRIQTDEDNIGGSIVLKETCFPNPILIEDRVHFNNVFLGEVRSSDTILSTGYHLIGVLRYLDEGTVYCINNHIVEGYRSQRKDEVACEEIIRSLDGIDHLIEKIEEMPPRSKG